MMPLMSSPMPMTETKASSSEGGREMCDKLGDKLGEMGDSPLEGQAGGRWVTTATRTPRCQRVSCAIGLSRELARPADP